MRSTWALDTRELRQLIPPALPLFSGLPFYVELGVGGLQLLIIGSMRLALNLTYRHLRLRDNL